MTVRHVAVVGSGSLASSICYALAALAPTRDGRPGAPVPIQVTLLARDAARAGEIARACRVRAAVGGTGVAFAAEALHDEAEAVARLRPAVLVCCASTQSPYERVSAPSSWTDLV